VGLQILAEVFLALMRTMIGSRILKPRLRRVFSFFTGGFMVSEEFFKFGAVLGCCSAIC